MKQLILDYSKWRCGGDYDNKLGEGETMLLNVYNFMCCLGQFSLQLSNLTEDDIRYRITPSMLYVSVPDLTDSNFNNSLLSRKAMIINDSSQTTPLEKIESLKKLFSEHGYSITVINLPTNETV